MPANSVDEVSKRLAVYGSLAPGKSNHWVLADLKGAWQYGWVRGLLHEEGWGSAQGFPGIVVDANGPEVEVQVFTSEDLPGHWAGIDEFEGPEYRRVQVPVLLKLSAVVCMCNIYELNR